jgi:type II secretory pathway pseudopilin PulG
VRARRRGEPGAAMIMALLVLFLLSVVLALLAESLLLRMRMARDESETVAVGTLSDSALEEAMAELALDPNYQGASKHDFGGGTLQTKVQSLGPGLYDITGTATYGGRPPLVGAQVFSGGGGGVTLRHWRRVPG